MDSEISQTPGWSPPEKIVADHLTPYLARHARKPQTPAGSLR